jgi:hypothetical protein
MSHPQHSFDVDGHAVKISHFWMIKGVRKSADLA